MIKQSIDYKKLTISIVLAVLVCVGLSFRYSRGTTGIVPNPESFSFLFAGVVGFLVFLFTVDKKISNKPTLIIPAILFTLISISANALYFTDGLTCLIESPGAIITTLLRLGGWYSLYYYSIKGIYIWLEDKLNIKTIATQRTKNITHLKKQHRLASFFEKHIILSTMILVLACELPYFIWFYPGLLAGDGYVQLTQALGLAQESNHHPILITYLMGFVFKAGRAIAGQAFGCFLFVFLQSIYIAFGWGVLVRYLQKIGCKGCYLLGVIAFFSLLPVFPNYAITFFKDMLWLTTFLLFALQFIGIYLGARNTRFSLLKNENLAYLMFGLTAVLLPFFNNKGIVLALPTILILLFVKKSRKMTIVLIFVICATSSLAWNAIGIKALGVENGSSGEMLSIAFQCTARYVKQHKEEISKAEEVAILAVLKNDSLAELADKYYPPNADYVKNTLGYKDKAELFKYARVWVKQGIKHPETYFTAFLASTYGYLSPFIGWINFNTYQMESGIFFNTFDTNWAINDKENFDMDFLFSRKTVENGFKAMGLVETTPPFKFLFNTGLYFYFFVILIFLLIRQKQWHLLALFMPALANFGICLLSPVNGCFRYAMLHIVLLPVYLAIFWQLNYKKYN